MTQRRLVLLRHAKAEPRGALDDAARALATRGRDQATVIGQSLKDGLGDFDLALVSTALRTRETFRLLAQQVDVGAHEFLDDLYEADVENVVKAIRGVDPRAGHVLVVGHEPTISATALHLHGGRDQLGSQVALGVPTATACILEVQAPWAELDRGGATMTQVLRAGV
ncbi:SixA phosphatase family protein [Bogoriella caseilytica]|uniref:Phosphohistidine phosphatase n=1 Tax=Bogoriella caseilytica TaxID=56055 RepID=A0A3N2BG72_9MICO|nr:histidine phosphatase family protein [Bogoriella caseilytica]ROR74259.1 phosphohistidine phosphatase [Bogoriella caseilytica]